MPTAIHELVIQRGNSFRLNVRWQQERWGYRTITAIAQSAPVRLTVPQHGIPAGWPAAITGVKGMSALNADDVPPKERAFRPVDVLDADTLELNHIDATGFTPYSSGGQVCFYLPVELDGYRAQMTIISGCGEALPLLQLTSEGNGIEIDPQQAVIRLLLTPDMTATLSHKTANYFLNLISPAGDVDTVMAGRIVIQ